MAAQLDLKKGRQPRLAGIITFALNTGCREDEICKLEWTDVDFEKCQISIRKKKVVETKRNADGQPTTVEYT
jgi:integrase